MARKKELDFEVNLIPFIDMLSVCVFFLLFTAVWVHIGSIDVKQAVGGQPASETKKEPALWAKMLPKGEVELTPQDFPSDVAKKVGAVRIQANNGKVDIESLKQKIQLFKDVVPELQTGLLMPEAEAQYDDIITVMDNMRAAGLMSLGVSPL